jgi:hypothetical protein
MRTADELLDEADRTPFQGWDFSWLEDRLVVEPPPWPFEDIVTALLETLRWPSTWELAAVSG